MAWRRFEKGSAASGGFLVTLALMPLFATGCDSAAVEISEFGVAVRSVSYPSALVAVVGEPLSIAPSVPPSLAKSPLLSFSCVRESLGPCGRGLSVEPRTGNLSWTPSAGDVGQLVPVTVRVSDGNRNDVVRFRIRVKENPLPKELLLEPVGATSSDALTCRALGTVEEGLKFEWLKNGEVIAGKHEAVLPQGQLVHGDDVACRLVATLSGVRPLMVTSDSLSVGNGKPVAVASLGPTAVDRSGQLTCSAEGSSDPDGDLLDLRFAWHRNGAPIPGATATFPVASVEVGDKVACELTVSDGTLEAVATSAEVVVGNRPPLVQAALSSASGLPTQTLTCLTAGSSDPDGGSLSFSYKWYKNEGLIPTENGALLALASFLHGDAVRCEVQATDAHGASASARSGEATVLNRPPLPQATLTPLLVHVSDALSCSALGSADPDGDVLVYSYAWLRNGVPIEGRTSSVLPALVLGVGDTASCRVTARDGFGGEVSATSESVVVQNRNPVAQAAITTTPVYNTVPLTCSSSGSNDPDGESITTSFAWYRNGSAPAHRIDLQTSATLPANVAQNGDVIRCEVTVSDGHGSPQTALSGPVTVANRNPVAQAALSPTLGTVDTEFSCSHTGSQDADGDALSYSYRWLSSGTPLAGQTALSLAARVAPNAATLTCEVTADDGHGGTHVRISNGVLIENRAPTAASEITSNPVHNTATVACSSVGSSDPDGDALSFTYAWYKNGTAPGNVIVGENSATLPAGNVAVGDVLRCQVTANDGHGLSHSLFSPAVSVANRTPVAKAAVLPMGASVGQTLTCAHAGSADPDGETLNYTYRWYKNGNTPAHLMAGEIASTLAPASYGSGDVLYCDVTATDPHAASHTALSIMNLIGNHPPTVAADITTSPIHVTAPVSCSSAGTTDSDGDSLTMSYGWRINGNMKEGQTGSTLPVGQFGNGDSLKCVVTADDGKGGVVTQESAAVPVQNRNPVAQAEITTSPAHNTAALTCSAVGSSDVDGDTLTYTYAWKRNTNLIAGQSSSTLPAGQVAVGDAVECVVTANDGFGGTHVATSASVTVANRNSVAQAAVTPSLAYNSTLLTCDTTGTSDPDGDPILITYVWRANGDVVAGQTAATLPGGTVANGAAVRCDVTVTDNHSGSAFRASSDVTIANRNPVAQAAITTSPAYVTDPLTCSSAGSNDADGDTLSFSYAWKKNGSEIAAQTSASLPVGQFRQGDSVQCVVTATDTRSGSHAATSTAVTIPNRNPVVQAAITTSPAHNTTALTCSPSGSSDADGDTLTYSYAWKKNAATISGQTSATLAVGQFVTGDSVQCVVTASDGSGGSGTATSSAVSIANRTPVAVASITTSPAYNDTPLTCSPAGSSDADGHTLNFSYAWKKNGSTISGQTAATLPTAQFVIGDSLTCSVTASDSYGGSHTATSDAVVIPNRTPMAMATLNGYSPTKGDTLTCLSTGSSDADGHALTFSYDWKRNGGIIVGQNASTLALASYAIGDTIACEVTATDPLAASHTASSTEATIQNRSPTAAAVVKAATTTTPYGGTAQYIINLWVDLQCDTTGSSDPDGDSLTFSYEWKKNGTVISGQTAQTLPRAQFGARDLVSCSATANDGRGGVHSANAASVTIPNANHDFNGDGYSDIFWQSNSSPQTNSNALWHMNGSFRILGARNVWNNPNNTGTVGSDGWTVVGQADMDGDATPDLVWYNNTYGVLCYWFGGGLDANGWYKWRNAYCTNQIITNTNWYAQGLSDFNGDGKPDILWHHGPTGAVTVYEMDGYTIGASRAISHSAAAPWYIFGSGDVDGNGTPDIIWQNRDATTGGTVVLWMMNGYTRTGTATLSNPGLSWHLTGFLDMNYDGRPEVLWQSCSAGSIVYWTLSAAGAHVSGGDILRASDNASVPVACSAHYMRTR